MPFGELPDYTWLHVYWKRPRLRSRLSEVVKVARHWLSIAHQRHASQCGQSKIVEPCKREGAQARRSLTASAQASHRLQCVLCGKNLPDNTTFTRSPLGSDWRTMSKINCAHEAVAELLEDQFLDSRAVRGPLVFSAITGGTQTQHWRGDALGRLLISLGFLSTLETGIVAAH